MALYHPLLMLLYAQAAEVSSYIKIIFSPPQVSAIMHLQATTGSHSLCFVFDYPCTSFFTFLSFIHQPDLIDGSPFSPVF